MEYYVADFETRTSAYSQTDTSVWLVYSENIYDSEDNILEINLINWFTYFVDKLKKSTTIFFHNLNFDGEFLMNYLADYANYVKPNMKSRETKLNKGEWTNTSDGPSSHYKLKYVNRNGVIISFKCSLKLLQASVAKLQGVDEKDKIDYDFLGDYTHPSQVSQEHLDYIVTDVRTVIPRIKNYLETLGKNVGLTSASSAQRSMKSFMGAELFKTRFVSKIRPGYIHKDGYFVEGDWDYLSNGYVGGYCNYNDGRQVSIEKRLIKASENAKIVSLDVNSLYPYIMRFFMLPYGFPYWYCKKVKCNHPLQLLEMKITATIKPGGVGFIPDSNKRGSDNIVWLDKVNNKTIWVTNDYWELIQKEYDIEEYKIIKKVCFEGQYDMFNEFFDHFQTIKQNSKGVDMAMYDLSKNIQNSTYGKFGMSYKRKQMFLRPLNKENDIRKNQVVYGYRTPLVFDFEWDLSTPVYIPMALWVTSHAKIVTIKLNNIVNKICNHIEDAGWLYSDTDSSKFLICNDCWDLLVTQINLDDKKLGAWGTDGEYKYFYCWGRKRYIMFDDLDSKERDIGFAGVDTLDLQKYTNRQLIEGVEFKKKSKVKVRGGVLLIEKTVKIK